MNIIFDVRGGIGKTIASTAVVQAIRKKYPKAKLIVESPYPGIFKNNPNIDHYYHLSDRGLIFNQFIKNKEAKILASEPYDEGKFLTREWDLLKTWYNLFDLPYGKEKPQMFLTRQEMEVDKELYRGNKPIMCIQTHGGIDSYGYNWARDLPDCVIKKVIEEFKDDYTIYHIKQTHQPKYENTITAAEDIRSIATLIHLSSKRLFIDSFAQHLAVAMFKKSTVCWVTTSPSNFGYSYHDNIFCNPYDYETEYSCYQGYNLEENINNLPFGDEERIFDVDYIIKSLKKQ